MLYSGVSQCYGSGNGELTRLNEKGNFCLEN